jgi:hypothetical protein
VIASGSPLLTYQWRFNGSDINGATNSAYTRFGAQTNNAGTYLVVVTNAYGSTSSPPATLTVNFSLTATATTGGTVTRNPDQPNYSPNSSVAVTATPNNGFAFIGWSGDAGGTNNPLSVQLTTNTSIVGNFVSTATDIIIDNSDPAASYIGDWQTGTTAAGHYGADYDFALTVAGGLSNATYRPYIFTPGYYDVYVWYAQGSNRATNAPWSVFYSSGSTNVPVDQSINGGAWLLIAPARPFSQGTNGFVRLANDTGYSGKVVIADAVRLLYSGPLPSPPHLDSINVLPDRHVSLQVSGSPGQYSIDGTTNLQDWAELTNFNSSTSNFTYIDAQTNFNARFYRARIIP